MSVQTRKRPGKGAQYVVRWRYEGRDKSKTFAKIKEAREFDASVHHSLAEATYVDPQRGKITLEKFSEEWIKVHQVSPSTKAKYQSLLDARIVPGLGKVPLESMTPLRVRTFLAGLPLAPSTVRSIAALLSSLSNAAVEDGRIKRSWMPAKLALPRDNADERVFLNREQVASLVRGAPDLDKALIHVAAWTGLRWGELSGLKIERLDLDKAVLEVRQGLVDVSGKLTFSAPKTLTSRRSVRLDPTTVSVLRVHLADFGVGRFGTVFHGADGALLQSDNWRKRVWLPLVAATDGVPVETRFHDLRHSHVALLIEAGVDLKSIQSRLGHSSVRVTGDRYAHLLQAVEDRSMLALDALAMGG